MDARGEELWSMAQRREAVPYGSGVVGCMWRKKVGPKLRA